MNDSMNSNASFSNKTDINTVDFPQVVIYTVAQFLLLTTEVYILAAFSQFVKKNRYYHFAMFKNKSNKCCLVD